MMQESFAYRLERPPVTSVSLRIRFKASPSLQNWMLAPFLTDMRKDHLSVEELPPYGGYGDPFEPSEEVDDTGTTVWPVPRTQFTTADRILAVQGNELEVTWTFNDADTGAYAGFDSLLSAMKSLYSRLVETVSVHGVRISPKFVVCFYVNSIRKMSAGTLAVGVLTQWSETIEIADPEQGYVGARLHGCANPDKHNCDSLIMVDSTDGGYPNLSIRVLRDAEDGEDPIVLLTSAHDELIALFRQHTSAALRGGWGEQ